ncbi:MAG: radical SAM/SPASM domain-containing protein [Dissulfurispiraceae bacterium]
MSNATEAALIKKLTKPGQSPDEYLSGILGSGYDEYRTLWANAGKGDIGDFPLQLDFQLNNRCNYRCPICYWSNPEQLQDSLEPPTEFPFAEFCRIVTQGMQSGYLKVINFEGLNEPLLKKDLPDYISFAKKAGVIDLTLHTNGLLLDDEWSKRLIQSGLTRLMVSIDAFSQETYYKVRGSRKYTAVLKNILNFLKLRKEMNAVLPILRVSFVFQPVNKHEVDDFREYWEQYADYILIQPLIDMTSLVHDDDYKNVEGEFCSQPFYRMSIKANGDVFPCCCSIGHVQLSDGGNVFREDISQLWRRESFERIRRLMKAGRYYEIPACKICLDHVFFY